MSESLNSLIPPATLEFLVASFRFQAELNLGVLPNPEGDNQGPNLPLARHFIDMLAMLQEKTRGNLTLEEQRLLENTVTELRFRYIHVFDQQQKKAAPAESAAAAEQG
jgi:hypothetical protein